MSLKRILVIEDDKTVRENIIILLEEEGYEVLTSSNGQVGLSVAREILPDLIVCDIMMPDMDGYEVLSNLSLDPSTKSIPFIFLTAKVDRADIRKGMELGADDYLFKPFRADELINAIKVRVKKAEEIYSGNSFHKDEKKVGENDTIFIESGNKAQFIKIRDIVSITAENQYSKIEFEDGKFFLIKRSLNSWESRLDSAKFIRIHRSTIVNLEYVKKVEKEKSGTYRIYLQNNLLPYNISRRYASSLRKFI